MLIKHDCTAGRKRKSSKQGFISLVFQAAVFSLSSAGSRRGRERERERAGKRREIVDEMWWEHKLGQIRVLLFLCLLSRGGPASRPWGTHLSEGILSPTEHSFSTVDHIASPFLYSHSPISKQQEAIRSCTCSIGTTKICIGLRFSSHTGHINGFSLRRDR